MLSQAMIIAWYDPVSSCSAREDLEAVRSSQIFVETLSMLGTSFWHDVVVVFLPKSIAS